MTLRFASLCTREPIIPRLCWLLDGKHLEEQVPGAVQAGRWCMVAACGGCLQELGSGEHFSTAGSALLACRAAGWAIRDNGEIFCPGCG